MVQLTLEAHELLFFHERDSEAVLKKLNILEKVNRREVMCAICKKIITKANLGGVLKKKGKVLIFCDDLKCLDKAGELRE